MPSNDAPLNRWSNIDHGTPPHERAKESPARRGKKKEATSHDEPATEDQPAE